LPENPGVVSSILTLPIPLRQLERKSYATIWSDDVQLLEGTATIPGPEPEYSFIRSVALSKLKELVRENSR
jgi:hypothetical protein